MGDFLEKKENTGIPGYSGSSGVAGLSGYAGSAVSQLKTPLNYCIYKKITINLQLKFNQ